MAYINQEKKREIAAELRTVVPKSWKWSLSIWNHTVVVMTIYAAPADLIERDDPEAGYLARSDEHIFSSFCRLSYNRNNFDGETLRILIAIDAALNRGNYNNSDPKKDHYDIGWNVYVRAGRKDRLFVRSAAHQEAA